MIDKALFPLRRGALLPALQDMPPKLRATRSTAAGRRHIMGLSPKCDETYPNLFGDIRAWGRYAGRGR
jgi:hypothetical protein